MKAAMEELFYEIFEGMPRLAPGSEEATLKALKMTGLENKQIKTLDIGCGTGAQTFILAKHLGGSIIAMDNYPSYLQHIQAMAKQENLTAQIETLCVDMKDLSSPPESLDLIWSEGAIYIIGFQEGLKKIWPMMKPGAFAVFSDMNYLKYDPPGELKAFFQEECPDMLHKNETIELITQSRFRLVGHFELNKDAHWKPYYQPLQERVYDYRAKYSENPDAMEISNNIQHEIDLFKKYSDYYAYVFYVMQKPYE